MAPDLATTLTAAPLSPSERVLLYGERFTTAQILLGTTNDPQVPLLHADVLVSSPQLGRTILLAAILASEKAGTITLEPRVKKQMLGLSSTDSLYADAAEGKTKVTWPTASLEARIRPTVDQLQADNDNEVSRVVVSLVPVAEDPWASAVGQVIEGLRSRGLLVETAVTEPHIFKPWVLSDEAKALVLEHDHAPIQQLLTDAQAEQPEVWKRLNEQLDTAIAEQTQQKT
jgi:hypothetical protein